MWQMSFSTRLVFPFYFSLRISQPISPLLHPQGSQCLISTTSTLPSSIAHLWFADQEGSQHGSSIWPQDYSDWFNGGHVT